MSLLGDIINELVDSNQSLEAPLLKTKVLATRLKNTVLIEWVNKELGGYSLTDELPDYRVYGANLSMDYIKGNYQFNNQSVPTQILPEPARSLIKDANFLQTIATLESLATSENVATSTLAANVPHELISLLQRKIRGNGKNHNFQILALRKLIPSNLINEVLANVRHRLLEFVLKLEEEFGTETDIVSLREKNQQITTIMYNTITTTGQGNVINTGDNASVQATVHINQGNLNELLRALRDKGVSEQDINELASVINSESVDKESQRFGPRVNDWIQKMYGKALNGGWEISVATAGGLLTELIKAYYGMGN